MILELQLKYKFLLDLVILARCGDDIAEQREGGQWKVILPTRGRSKGGDGGSHISTINVLFL